MKLRPFLTGNHGACPCVTAGLLAWSLGGSDLPGVSGFVQEFPVLTSLHSQKAATLVTLVPSPLR